MIPTRTIHCVGIGDFVIPVDTEAHSKDGEACVREVCGCWDPELAKRERNWGDRAGMCYSYRGRHAPEPVTTFLDVGHNIGAATVWACRYWWPATIQTVHMYDPNPGCAEIARKNIGLVQRCIDVQIHTVAVTSDPCPLFIEDERWGCSWTKPESADIDDRRPIAEPLHVPAVHPRDLPRAQALKLDAEGVEGEIIDHYPWWDGVHVLMIEWHSHEDRLKMLALAHAQGWRLAKNDCGQDMQGVACWVRT